MPMLPIAVAGADSASYLAFVRCHTIPVHQSECKTGRKGVIAVLFRALTEYAMRYDVATVTSIAIRAVSAIGCSKEGAGGHPL